MKKNINYLLLFLIIMIIPIMNVKALEFQPDGKTYSIGVSFSSGGGTAFCNCIPSIKLCKAVKSGTAHTCNVSSTTEGTVTVQFGYEDAEGLNHYEDGSPVKVTFKKDDSGAGEEGSDKISPGDDNWDSTFNKLCDINSNPRIMAVFRLLGILLIIIKVVVPIILIVYGMIDLFNVVVEGKEDSVKNNVSKFIRRLLIGGLVFFAPTIILGIFELVDGWAEIKDDGFGPCITCMLDPSTCSNAKIANN